jgi:hypothetical protein
MCRNIVVAHYDILSGGFYLPVSAGPDGLLREVNNTVHATMVILVGQSDDIKATCTKGVCVHCPVTMGRGDDAPPPQLVDYRASRLCCPGNYPPNGGCCYLGYYSPDIHCDRRTWVSWSDAGILYL